MKGIEIKKNTVITILLVLTILPFSGCVSDKDKDVDDISVNYTLDISISNVNADFFIILPAPIYNHNNSVITIISNRIITELGLNRTIITNTTFGFGMNLTSNENIDFNLNGKLKWYERYSRDAPPMYLDMGITNDSKNWIIVAEEYAIYSSESNLTLIMSFKITYGGGMFEWSSDQLVLKEGWQTIVLKENAAIP